MMDGIIDAETEQMPRIGSDYQAELPDLMSKSDYIHLTEGRSHLEDSKTSSDHAAAAVDYRSWSVREEDAFLLALYIFGRNFVLVKKFIGGSKSMEDVLSHFYATFYRSERYCKWLECKKGKTRKYAHGAQIFTGLRQQELLSRLFPLLSNESDMKLINEVSKSLEECKMSLEEYVFAIKDMVGLNNLIEAIGIGKEKHDLTRTAIHHPRIISPLLQKSYSELSSAEIVSFIKSGDRLSKAKSIDLFWEAVWPRLLANGWHSEESRKNVLVFVIPGVDKFSRRVGLVKGRHYFGSANDVLSRVASEPQLIQIEGVDQVISDRSEYSGAERNSEQEGDEIMSGEEECYLGFNMAETDIFKPVKKKKKKPINDCYSKVKVNVDESLLSNGETQLCRRQSGRKRRMTTRALESLALSYMDIPSKKRRDFRLKSSCDDIS